MCFFYSRTTDKNFTKKRCVKKQKRDTASSKDDELDLLGDDVD